MLGCFCYHINRLGTKIMKKKMMAAILGLRLYVARGFCYQNESPSITQAVQ